MTTHGPHAPREQSSGPRAVRTTRIEISPLPHRVSREPRCSPAYTEDNITQTLIGCSMDAFCFDETLPQHINTLDKFKNFIKPSVNAVRRAESTRSECPEEIETFQALCQFIHSHPDMCKDAIEWVFSQLGSSHMLHHFTDE